MCFEGVFFHRMNLVDVDLWDVASCCPDNVTGADISALCNRALMLAVQRKVQYMETYSESSSTLFVSLLSSNQKCVLTRSVC